eukprot:gene22041-24987_t
MGNKTSVATLRVVFDNPDALSGTSATGKAYLSVNKDEVSCGSIGCRVLGQEITQVRYTRTTGSGKNKRTTHHTAHQRTNFMDQRFCLLTLPTNTIRRGQYEYPFQFTIPNNAPASMSAGGRAHASCSISYSVEVWLDRPGFMRWDIKHQQFLNVSNPAPVGTKVPLYIEPCQVPVHSFCCIHRGNILMGGAAESSILSAGGPASVKYAMQNSSTVPVKAIEVTLTEIVRFSAQGHHSSSSTALFHTRLSPQDAGLDQALRPLENGSQGGDLMALRDMLESDRFKVNFNIPAGARNTYNGSIIHVEHSLMIKVITTFGSANPTLQRPIQMFSRARPEFLTVAMAEGSEEDEGASFIKNPSAPEEVHHAVPAGWSPSVAQRVELPPLALCYPVAHLDQDDNAPVTYVSVSAYPAIEVYKTFDQFLAALKQNYDPCGKLERYIRYQNTTKAHALDALTAPQFYAMFSAVPDSFDQQRFAEILAVALSCISCDKVAQAARACRDICKREVVEKLLTAGPITDKATGANLIRNELTPFQFMTVEKYFQ